jgi:asparagine synthase (glutamine-hydrolysing)
MHLEGTGLWITYNGEVYNYRDIRRDLESQGYRFRSQTDTEVVMAAYARWGVRCLDRFVGMFAFAIWDETRKRLFLARDRLGKKPLYYASYAGRFAFASELKALLADREFPRDIDPDAVSLYLRYGYVPAPYSIFRAARKLPGGHFAVFENGHLKVERYWDPVEVALSQPFPGDVEEAETELSRILADSVAGRMISDVPLGAFLSGGIDSSLVVALMQEQATRPVQTFTIRFNEPRFNEADHAAAVARHLGTEHHEEVCDVSQMLDILDVLPDYFDEPFADASAIPTYLVSKSTRKHVTVALSGDGGDELFFGYWRYHSYAATRRLLEAPRPVRRTLAAIASKIPNERFHRAADALQDDESDRYSRFITWWNPQEIAKLTARSALLNPVYSDTLRRVGSLPPDERPPILDLLTYLPEDILVKVDRASMAVSLEARAPLLDHRVVEFALRLPQHMKFRRGQSKSMLRRILYRRVPRELLERPKMGFGVPMAEWLRGPLRDQMNDLVSSSELLTLGIEPTFARTAWSDFLQGRFRSPDVIWNLLALIRWSRRWRTAVAPALEPAISLRRASSA